MLTFKGSQNTGMKLRLPLLLVFTVIVSSTGCIKDSDNIKFAPLQNPGIGFPFGSNAKNDYILRPSATAQQVSGLLFVNLEANSPAASDIHITVADNSAALVNAYNAANGTAIQPLPRSLWSIPAQLIIKAGERNAQGDITVLNTQGLNFNTQYAIGLRIASADGGNKIADNLSSLFIVFRIQNQYDGRYSMTGQFYHPVLEPTFAHHNLLIELHTSGPNSVRFYWPLASQYTVPVTSNGGQPFLGIYSSSTDIDIEVNPSNNNAVVYNGLPGGGITFGAINFYNGNTYINRWDPATQKFYAAFGYNIGLGGIFVSGTSRAWIDTLTYLGPR